MRATSAGGERKRHYEEFMRPKTIPEQVERLNVLDAKSRAPLPAAMQSTGTPQGQCGGRPLLAGGRNKYHAQLPIDVSDSRIRREVFGQDDAEEKTRDMSDKALSRVVERREARRALIADAAPTEVVPDPWDLQVLLMKKYTSFGTADAADINQVLHSKGVVADVIHRHAESAELRSGIQHEIGEWVAEVQEKRKIAADAEDLDDRLMDMKRESHEMNASMHVLDVAVDKMETSIGQLTNVQASIESLHRRAQMAEMNLFGDTAQRKHKTRTVGSATELTFHCGLGASRVGGEQNTSSFGGGSDSPRKGKTSPLGDDSNEPITTAEIIATNAEALQQQASKEEQYIQQILKLDEKLSERHDIIIDLMTMLENRNRNAAKESSKHAAELEAKHIEILMLQAQLESIRTGRAFSELWKALDEHEDGGAVKSLIRDVIQSTNATTAVPAAAQAGPQPDIHNDKKWLLALQMVREKEASGAVFKERNELLLKVKRLEESVANSKAEAEHQSDLLADMSDKFTAADRERQHFKALTQFMERDSLEKTQRIAELEKQLRDTLQKLTATEADKRSELDRTSRQHEQIAQVLRKTIAELQKAIEKSEQEDTAVQLRAANVKIHELDIANRSLKSLSGALESRMEDAANEVRLVTRVAAASLQNISRTVLELRKQIRDTTSGRMLDMLRMCSWKATQDLIEDAQSMLRAIAHRASEEPSIQSATELLSSAGDDALPPAEGDEGVAKLEHEIQRLVVLQRETMTRYRQMEAEAGELKRKRHQVLNTVRDAVSRLVTRKSLSRSQLTSSGNDVNAAEGELPGGATSLISADSNMAPSLRRRATTSVLSGQVVSQSVFDGVDHLIRDPTPVQGLPSWGGRLQSFRRRSTVADETTSPTGGDKLELSSNDLDATTGSAQRALPGVPTPTASLSTSTSRQFDATAVSIAPQPLVVDRLFHDDESQRVLDEIFTAGHEQILAAEEELETNLQDAVDTTAQAQRKVMETMAAAAAPSYGLLHGALTLSEVLRALSMEVATRVVGPIEAGLAANGYLDDELQSKAAQLINQITKDLPAKNRRLLLDSVKLRIFSRGRLEAYRVRLEDRIRSMVTLSDAEEAATLRRRMHMIEQNSFKEHTRILMDLAEVHRQRLRLTEELVSLVSCSSLADVIMSPSQGLRAPASPSLADQLHDHVVQSMASTRDACNSPVMELLKGGTTADATGVIASLEQKVAEGNAVVEQYASGLSYLASVIRDPAGLATQMFMERVPRCPSDALRRVKQAVQAVIEAVQPGILPVSPRAAVVASPLPEKIAPQQLEPNVGPAVAQQYSDALKALGAFATDSCRRLLARDDSKQSSTLPVVKASQLKRVPSCPETTFLDASTLLTSLVEGLQQTFGAVSTAVRQSVAHAGKNSPRASAKNPQQGVSHELVASRDSQIAKLTAELTDAKTKLHQLLKEIASEKYRHIDAKLSRSQSTVPTPGATLAVPVYVTAPTVLGPSEPIEEPVPAVGNGPHRLSLLSCVSSEVVLPPPAPSLPTYVLPTLPFLDTPTDTPVLEMVDHSCSPVHFESRPGSAMHRPGSAKRPSSALERRASVGISDGFTQTVVPFVAAVGEMSELPPQSLQQHQPQQELDAEPDEFPEGPLLLPSNPSAVRNDHSTQTGEDLLADFLAALLRLPPPPLEGDIPVKEQQQRRPMRVLPHPLVIPSSVEKQWTTLRSRLHRLVHDAKQSFASSSPPPPEVDASGADEGPALSVIDIPPVFADVTGAEVVGGFSRSVDASIELYAARRAKTDSTPTGRESDALHDAMADILRHHNATDSSEIVKEYYREVEERARDVSLHRPVTALEREKLRIAMRTADASRGARQARSSSAHISRTFPSRDPPGSVVDDIASGPVRGAGPLARALCRGRSSQHQPPATDPPVLQRLPNDQIHIGITPVTLVAHERRTSISLRAK